jgi:hypothetical protein
VLILWIVTILCSDFPLYHTFVIEQVGVCNAPDLDSGGARFETRPEY